MKVVSQSDKTTAAYARTCMSPTRVHPTSALGKFSKVHQRIEPHGDYAIRVHTVAVVAFCNNNKSSSAKLGRKVPNFSQLITEATHRNADELGSQSADGTI